ncbi:uncharacterized protein LOC132699766 [Cylas formicarius]|uniref:uncharacterized protein LOC132699766 n=1 Tax=Cylas formicarius TaxID=197179 RepID=UPI002958601B|nr:uncharacterized protein LOC132699766 [Cylas formicarius]
MGRQGLRVKMFSVLVLPTVLCLTYAAPSIRIMPEHLLPPQLLTLPSNATSIRSEISDSFSCEGREYGYYADVENDCQLFHVCLPMKYSDGRSQTFRWSFICPEETIFNQEMFTCTRSDESMDCSQSPQFYELNRNFGSEEETSGINHHRHPAILEPAEMPGLEKDEDAPSVPAEVPQSLARNFVKKSGKVTDN